MKIYKCEKCDIFFSRKNNLNRHLRKKHPSYEQQIIAVTPSSSSKKDCPFCNLFFQDKDKLIEHMWSPQHQSLLPFTSRSSISQKVVIYRMSLEENNASLANFCSSNRTVNTINNLVTSQTAIRTVFRMSIVIFADYEIPDLSQEETGEKNKSVDNDTLALRSKGLLFNQYQSERQRRNRIRSMLRGAAKSEEDLLTRGSGWRFQTLKYCDIVLYDSSNIL